jgi:hypothetical protein
VEHVEPRPGGGFTVTVAGPAGRQVREYDTVLVANGHHWDPKWPEPAYPGSFDGEQLHAHDYREPDQLAGKRVVVVGMGNSAMDIAVDASYVAASTTISVRRGQWLFPKFLLGRPSDQTPQPTWLPWSLRRRAFDLGAKVTGDLTRYGLPEPDHRPGESHPVQGDRFVARLRDGRVAAKGAIERLAGDRVVFRDGTEVVADVIVWCTGYKVSFPFFDPGVVSAPDNDLPLWKRVVHPDVPGAYFLGLLQPLGAVMPLAEAQSAWVAEILTGRYVPPTDDVVRQQMRVDHEAMKRRFYSSSRHTMEVDFDGYLDALAKERAAGRERAAARTPVA